jgi:hypothetical protein
MKRQYTRQWETTAMPVAASLFPFQVTETAAIMTMTCRKSLLHCTSFNDIYCFNKLIQSIQWINSTIQLMDWFDCSIQSIKSDDWLIDKLIDRLIDQLLNQWKWSIDKSINHFDWLIDNCDQSISLINWWSIGESIHQLITLIDWSIDLPINQSI